MNQHMQTLLDIESTIDGAREQAEELAGEMNDAQLRAWTKRVLKPINDTLNGIDTIKVRVEERRNGSQ